MSCNYADGLSPYTNKGKLGLPEVRDEAEDIGEKIKTLAKWISESKHAVVHTGAGCSTSAGIPDFRGPRGVWTLEKIGQKPDISVSFDEAAPTKAHMIIKSFLDTGHLKYIVTQNIDGLHLKSNVPRDKISELHGNMFVAKCTFCHNFVIQKSAVPTVGQKKFGVKCPLIKGGKRNCRGELMDTLLDWDHNLPENELETAIIHSTLSDLSICLGTTLQIVPAGNLPLKAKKNPGGKLVIINLQPTKHDKKADLIIHEKIDTVMSEVAKILDINWAEYMEDIDPTKLLNKGSNFNPNWTISDSSVKGLKKMISVRKEGSKVNLKRKASS